MTEIGEIKYNENMCKHTSFKIGGKAELFVIPKNLAEIKTVLNFASKNKLPLLVIGNGTNILFPDTKIKGIVMQIKEPYFCKIQYNKTNNECYVKASAGLPVSSLLDFLCKKGLSGAEFLAGIPGTIGGAISMNAGAYGKNIGELVSTVKVLDSTHKLKTIPVTNCNFGYRESRFKKNNEIILSTVLKLKQCPIEKIKENIQNILKYREEKLPTEEFSAGCIFKNPPKDSAGKLIELAGCKGLRIGDAEISHKHANFIINRGNAKANDVLQLISKVKQRVKQKTGISLELEVKIINTNKTTENRRKTENQR